MKNGRPLQTPGERPTKLDLRLEVRQPAAVFSNRNGSWELLKKHIFPAQIPSYVDHTTFRKSF